MKTKITWRPRKRKADRSFGTAQVLSPATELFSQVSRVHAGIV
jgi:hypothetical protein